MTQKEFDEIMEYAKQLRARKNADYGNAFLKDYNESKTISTSKGNVAIYTDLKRKFVRLDNLLLQNCKVKVCDETVEDTLIDMAVMCINAVVALRARKDIDEKQSEI